MDSYCATFSPSPKNHLNHKNHSQDGWVWVLRPLLIYFSRHILNNHLNHKNHSQDGWVWELHPFFNSPPRLILNHQNHSLDDGYGLFSVFLPNFK